jgi:hypothetical protein
MGRERGDDLGILGVEGAKLALCLGSQVLQKASVEVRVAHRNIDAGERGSAALKHEPPPARRGPADEYAAAGFY